MPNYKRNFIKEALIRIDFEKSITELTNSINEDLSKFIIENGFSSKVPRSAFSDQITLDGSTREAKTVRTNFNEWNYYSMDKTKRICISKDYVFIHYTQYLNYNDFVLPFLSIIADLMSKYKEIKAKRVGMRFINHVKIDEGSPMDWSEYIDDNLLCIFSVPINREQIIRAFQILDLKDPDDDINLRFQYGMFNPDFPSKIRQKVFALDFDAFKTGSLTIEEIQYIIPKCHKYVYTLFEKSIREKLRAKMNG